MQFKGLFASVFSAAILVTGVFAAPETVMINGRGIGISLNSRGAMVTEANSSNSLQIKNGDVITKIDGKEIHSVSDLQKNLSESKSNPVMVTLIRNGSEITLKAKPTKTNQGDYCLGVKAKDVAEGIGTLTFYDPETGDFGALGHGITDSVSGNLINIEGGSVLSSTIVAVKKGEKGNPGELQGIFSEGQNPLGEISQNTPCGIFGKMTLSKEEMENCQSIKVGTKDDVRVGKAYILANIQDSKCEKFEIEITKIPVFSGDKTKGMVIKITDKNLLSKTGGIVRGMSGCPIVQSGRLVGAVTHVFVNDPTMGYGIFIEDMLSEAEKIK